ncbi:MAG: UDP-N-acetylmuramate--L-alanine ligase [Spirochaetaceae bacterium]|jgi:UDP-N-acetylmuramate--alanine ligase|nr:UDP-N-acetylmuramate--L-alanine ligase [Spirochaetaceae bacterium]
MDFREVLRPGALIYFVGIKGTGMCALAELMRNDGISVSGSDGPAHFYTDAILKELGIPYHEAFEASHISGREDLVVHSAAYSPDTNPELVAARQKGLPILKYPDALGAYSAGFDASGIAGVHGKTTTTAMAGTLIRAAGLPARVLAGSGVSGFGGRSTLSLGDTYFVAETCEYRRHFLAFHPRRIVLTSVESDHQDYYPTYASIRDAFLEYVRKLPPGGELIYCADDPGAREVSDIVHSDVIRGETDSDRGTAASWSGGEGRLFVPYGFSAEGAFGIEAYRVAGERIVMGLRGFEGEFRLRVPGRHSAQNAAAALALTDSLVKKEFGGGQKDKGWTEERLNRVREALEDFRGSKRRSEIIGEAGGILFMDDYGHHPTAIKTTLAGLREFYRGRRLVVSFMSHTYSRTAALIDDFAASLGAADLVFLHKIYPSAREEYRGGVTGKTLFEKTRAHTRALYYEEPEDALEPLKKALVPGDLFITLGAGDNWKLGKALFDWKAGAPPGSG